MEFKNRTFIVTGGASGLGGATTKALLERGATVVVADLKGEAPEGATFVATDVTDEQQVSEEVRKEQIEADLPDEATRRENTERG